MGLDDILRTFSEEKVVEQTPEGKYVEKDSGGVSLKGVLQRGRLKLRKGKNPTRQGVGFRPSGITFRFCERAKVGQLAGRLTLYDDKPAPSLQLVFDMGHAIHDIFQGYFWDIGILRGDFRCLKCDTTYTDLLAPEHCPKYKTHDRKYLVYKEVQVPTNALLIRGRSDGILEIEGESHIVDIKSIANRTAKTPHQFFCFEDLEDGPKDAHLVQLQLYMHFIGIHRGHLLYVAKNDHKIKTFAIPYDYEIIRPYLETIQRLIDLSDALSKGERVQLPDPCGRDDCACETIISGPMPV